MKKYLTDRKINWCPGCGNFGILNAVQIALNDLEEKSGITVNNIAMTSGIGCHGKLFDYLSLSGVYSLHGRGLATAQGIKLGNPDLTVISFGGDGDSLGEGLEHTLFTAKRNEDITLILHNNGVYGLTTGQFAPTCNPGYLGPSTPKGSLESPFHAISLMISANATFIARSYTAKTKHLSDMIFQAVNHKGFSFIEVLQPCVSFNNTYDLYNQKTRIFEEIPDNDIDAYKLSKDEDFLYLGIFKKEIKPVFNNQVYNYLKS